MSKLWRPGLVSVVRPCCSLLFLPSFKRKAEGCRLRYLPTLLRAVSNNARYSFLVRRDIKDAKKTETKKKLWKSYYPLATQKQKVEYDEIEQKTMCGKLQTVKNDVNEKESLVNKERREIM
ncbi:hypothetical protein NDU88_003204 [Pleurodeles waltl]|uniref:Uncharacterized protein n=1 Tax=Pleurodeles waltl TaxID=8319 RepID=A0AAV7W1G5_PLEWA|nr:hypothetical protein NDU88_003204 [Pleurodeles waltl]